MTTTADGGPGPLPELLTAAKAAERLGVGRATIYRWVATGRLKVAHEEPTLFLERDIDAAKAELEAGRLT